MGSVERVETSARLLLRRVYREYQEDPALAQVRSEADGVLVPGHGAIRPKLMFVGEAPGAQEAMHRRPFIGASGKLLDEMLESIALSREEVFITNVVKYRPKDNRDPTPAETAVGRAYLWREQAALGHPPIVALGRHAAMALGADPKMIAQWQYVGGSFAPVLALRHPAYGIYQRANRPIMFEQFKQVRKAPSNDPGAPSDS